jgi:hypothetical protein
MKFIVDCETEGAVDAETLRRSIFSAIERAYDEVGLSDVNEEGFVARFSVTISTEDA